jgi:hypothetical protein
MSAPLAAGVSDSELRLGAELGLVPVKVGTE